MRKLILDGLGGKYWESDPSVFSPERFYEDPNGGSLAGLYSNAPFGNGARRCLGERLGLAEARLVVAAMVSKWEIVLVPEGPGSWTMQEQFAGTIKPSEVRVVLKEL